MATLLHLSTIRPLWFFPFPFLFVGRGMFFFGWPSYMPVNFFFTLCPLGHPAFFPLLDVLCGPLYGGRVVGANLPVTRLVRLFFFFFSLSQNLKRFPTPKLFSFAGPLW